MIIVRILDVDDLDVEHCVGWEGSSVAFAVFSPVQVRLELLVNAVLVHADGTFRVGAADQWFVRVLGIEACAVRWEFLIGTYVSCEDGKGKGGLLTESVPVILS